VSSPSPKVYSALSGGLSAAAESETCLSDRGATLRLQTPGARTRCVLQGYFAHKKTPTPLGPLYGPEHGPTVGSWGAAVSYERSTPVLDAGRLRAWTSRRGALATPVDSHHLILTWTLPQMASRHMRPTVGP